MTSEDCEAHLFAISIQCNVERSVSLDINVRMFVRLRCRLRRGEEGITALSTEEMLFVIRTLPQPRVIQSDKALVNYWSLAVETLRSKDLDSTVNVGSFSGQWRQLTS